MRQKESGPSGDRTHDLQIISLALYQLSYRTILVDMQELFASIWLGQLTPNAIWYRPKKHQLARGIVLQMLKKMHKEKEM